MEEVHREAPEGIHPEAPVERDTVHRGSFSNPQVDIGIVAPEGFHPEAPGQCVTSGDRRENRDEISGEAGARRWTATAWSRWASACRAAAGRTIPRRPASGRRRRLGV